MAQRRFHYEQAFEHFLRANRVPYVAVDEARKALMPAAGPRAAAPAQALKSFDFVVYTQPLNLLIDVKGRAYRARNGNRRFESWVTRDDLESLAQWERLFGQGFQACFVFIYLLRDQPPDALFDEFFEFNSQWYALREVRLEDYRRCMVQRSAKWHTMHVPAAAFESIARPFTVRGVVTA